MEKRIIGIILTLLGIAGLIYAGVEFMNGSGKEHVKKIVMFGILGAIFFFSGIGLIKKYTGQSKLIIAFMMMSIDLVAMRH